VLLTDVIIGGAILLALSQALFACQLDRPVLFMVAPLVAAGTLATARRRYPACRAPLAFTLLPCALLVYGFEGRLAQARPLDASMAGRRGTTFDTRSLWEAISDARARGRDAYPSMQPRALMVLDLERGSPTNDLQNLVLSSKWGVEIDDAPVLPLGGVSGRHIVFCNEGGTYAEFESDEHGFNNPRGIWTRDTIDAAIVGDSFTQGACVGPDDNAARWIREKYPATLNLGMSGNGPLLELAGLQEYIAPKKPATVFWIYYNNDLAALDVERRLPLLRRYLDEETFTQGLAERQEKIDEALVALSRELEARVRRWPGLLEDVGLTRAVAPVWLGDLVMRESHSSATAVMRLDRVTWGLTTRLVRDPLASADFPLFERVLARAKNRVESWGGKLYFVYMADLAYLRYKGTREHPYRKRVLSTAAALGIPVIDAQPRFFGVSDPMDVTFHAESHCNPAGYRLLADVMLNARAADARW
jgi:hypothetical protein